LLSECVLAAAVLPVASSAIPLPSSWANSSSSSSYEPSGVLLVIGMPLRASLHEPTPLPGPSSGVYILDRKSSDQMLRVTAQLVAALATRAGEILVMAVMVNGQTVWNRPLEVFVDHPVNKKRSGTPWP
jgi:hypothetical protein